MKIYKKGLVIKMTKWHIKQQQNNEPEWSDIITKNIIYKNMRFKDKQTFAKPTGEINKKMYKIYI